MSFFFFSGGPPKWISGFRFPLNPPKMGAPSTKKTHIHFFQPARKGGALKKDGPPISTRAVSQSQMQGTFKLPKHRGAPATKRRAHFCEKCQRAAEGAAGVLGEPATAAPRAQRCGRGHAFQSDAPEKWLVDRNHHLNDVHQRVPK